jgi:hypothetical protein
MSGTLTESLQDDRQVNGAKLWERWTASRPVGIIRESVGFTDVRTAEDHLTSAFFWGLV